MKDYVMLYVKIIREIVLAVSDLKKLYGVWLGKSFWCLKFEQLGISAGFVFFVLCGFF